MLQAFATSTLAVALAETGDKTQLLAIVLATKFKRPIPIILGVLVATVICNFLASITGASIAGLLQGTWFQCITACSFIVMGLWSLIPEKDEEHIQAPSGHSVFWTTLFCFLLAETGDRTQVATVALAAQFQSILVVGLGATLGMMLTNIPAVLFGEKITKVIPVHAVKMISAVLYMTLGAWMLVMLITKIF